MRIEAPTVTYYLLLTPQHRFAVFNDSLFLYTDTDDWEVTPYVDVDYRECRWDVEIVVMIVDNVDMKIVGACVPHEEEAIIGW